MPTDIVSFVQPQIFHRIDIELEWTLRELLEKIKEWEGIIKTDCAEKYRLRNQEKKSLYIKEELDKKLKDLEFQQGGIRLLLETGEVPGLEDIALKVKEYASGASVNVFVKAETTVAEW